VRLYHAYLRAVGLGWVFEDERFKNAPFISDENREILRDIMFEKAQEKTLDEWMEIYVADGDIAAEPYLYTVEGMQHPQFVHNKHVVEIDDPRVGKLKRSACSLTSRRRQARSAALRLNWANTRPKRSHASSAKRAARCLSSADQTVMPKQNARSSMASRSSTSRPSSPDHTGRRWSPTSARV
jgi:crotonobetainyl-CoA:carnitine CoA-transferase CaiB-like acyl-CoA transferase